MSQEQQRVVAHGAGALLVFAGPGSGKTRTLTARIAELLTSGGATPQEILALTFTVRATEEMRVRLTGLIGQQAASAVTVATFHSLGARILRLYASAFGRTASYSVYDSDDVLRVIRDLLAEGEHGGHAPPDDLAGEALSQIAMAKSRLASPAALRDQGHHQDGGRIAAIWEGVEHEMRQSNAFDFADLLTNPVALLTSDPALRKRYRTRWRHIVVDEFQDTDPAQFALLQRLAGPSGGAPHGSLIVAGDDDQLLYPWRGADVENLLGFRSAFPCASELVLRRNTAAGRRSSSRQRDASAITRAAGPRRCSQTSRAADWSRSCGSPMTTRRPPSWPAASAPPSNAAPTRARSSSSAGRCATRRRCSVR